MIENYSVNINEKPQIGAFFWLTQRHPYWASNEWIFLLLYFWFGFVWIAKDKLFSIKN